MILTLCHPLDYLRMLLGDVESLWAFTARRGGLDLPVEDTAEIGLRFASGAIGSVHLDYLQQPATHTLEIVGSAGTLRWNNADGALSIYRPGAARLAGRDAARKASSATGCSWMRCAISCPLARGEAAPACTLEDGIRALKIALRARESAADGQRKLL